MQKQLLLVLILLFSGMSYGQGNIRFINNNLDAALAKAKQKDKLIFVDTYAPWCIPCKKMDKVFRDPQLSKYFNETFVNLRVSMDNSAGKIIHTQYEVVFLPTLLILNSDGQIRFKIDQLISTNELLAIAKQIAEPEVYGFDTAEAETSSPSPTKPTPKVSEDTGKKVLPKQSEVVVSSEPIEEEKILYVLDSRQSVPPEVLYQEAYFRMQLMDNSHHQAAREYLATQTNWTSKKNLRFIHDFLYATDTEEFEYFIATRSLFEEEVGKEQVAQTIQILVNDRLQRGYPRPDLDEAIELVSLMGNSDAVAYEYYLDRLYEESKITDFINHSRQYLSDVNKNDHKIMFRLAECQLLTTSKPTKKNYKECLDLVHKAILIHEGSHEYWDTQSYLYYKLGNKKKAAYSIKKAIRLANEHEKEIDEMLILQEMINDL